MSDTSGDGLGEPDWIPLESNPDVLNEFLWTIGLPDDCRVVDVFGLDEELLPFIEGPVLSLIFLYPINEYNKTLNDLKPIGDTKLDGNTADDNGVYYLCPAPAGACGTLALFHAIANNCHRIQLKDNSILKTFIDSTRDLSPAEKGKHLATNEDIKTIHHKYAAKGQTVAPRDDRSSDGHFIALINKNGFIYVMDGRRLCGRPLNYGKTSDETFLSDAASICRQIMARDPNNSIFNVLALTSGSQ